MIKLNRAITLNELAKLIGAELRSFNNSSNLEYIDSVSTIDLASNKDVTFLASSLYVKYLKNTKAAAVILSPKYLDQCQVPALVTDNPRLALAKLLNLCNKALIPGIHPSSVIGKNVRIGNNVTIEAGVVIGNDCVIDDHSVIKANVVLYDGVRIGKNCIVHSNTVIGCDGFGYAQDNANKWVKMPHLGGVIIEDNVEIGSNTSIDRGCIGDTVIQKGVIIDNLVQIAHNVIIGENTAIAGCTGIAGSSTIGRNCLIGGAVSIAGHLFIADHVQITATSSISKSLLKSGVYSSALPAKDNFTWKRNIARFNCLDQIIKDLYVKIKDLGTKLSSN